ncbi:hypothetical protein I3300191I4_09920 [Megasphaera elsdenii]
MSILQNLLSYVLTSALDKRKAALKEELQKKIDETDSEWVKIWNKGWLALIDAASPFVLSEIEKRLEKE